MSTCDQSFKKPAAIYLGRISLVNHVMHPPAPGLRANDSGGLSPPSPSLHPSLRPPAITMGRDVEVQNTQMIRCWTFTALVSYRSAPGSSWGKAKPLHFLYFYFSKTVLSPWLIIFKAGGVKASVWLVVESCYKTYLYPTAEPEQAGMVDAYCQFADTKVIFHCILTVFIYLFNRIIYFRNFTLENKNS